MEKQSKLNKYLKPVAPGTDIFESSDFDIESGENRGSLGDKKQPNLMNFLRKIDQLAIDIMEKYVADHKYMLDVAQKNKITLFEDVYIICEYRRNLEALKKDRTKVVDALCERLQVILKRSKVTIKERMSKKLARCSVEDVLQAIQNKKDIVFDKEKPKKIILVPNEDADNLQSKPQAFVGSQPTNGPVAPENEKKADNKKREKETQPERFYKYGTKKLKERIYIYANLEKNVMVNFTASTFEETKQKFGIDLPFVAMKTEESNQRNEELPEPKRQQASQQQVDQPNLSGQELQTLIDNVMEKAASVLSQCNEAESVQKREEVKGYLETIRVLQEKLGKSESTTKDKTFQSDISEQPLASGQTKKRARRNTTGKKTSTSSPQSDKTQKDEQNKKLMYKLSNNIKYLEMLKNDSNLINEYMWEQQEDTILFSFKFNPEAYQTEMICLLRYKPRTQVLERMKFLNLEVDFSLIDQINHLDNRKLEKVEPQELMNVE